MSIILGHAPPSGDDGGRRVPVFGATPQTLTAVLERQGSLAVGYAATCGFTAAGGEVLLVPDEKGALACVLFGMGSKNRQRADPFLAGKLASLLPTGAYRLGDGFDDPFTACLSFALGCYRFKRFRDAGGPAPWLEVGDDIDGSRVAMITRAVALGRDLINRPANDLGPDAMEQAIRDLAETHGAGVSAICGEELRERFPMIHAVGRAAAQAPRLIDVAWGDEAAPKVTLVGKGVCFDTGGLDIKPSAGMLLMKKDMGGAATAMALADMVMGARLPVRLRVIVPVVENAIAGNAFRPGDVLRSRKGLTVEVGNTDAEGRLILADALALADEEAPDLLFDFATLTGAARVALGPDLPPYYTMDDDVAEAIAKHGMATNDPGWRMPLWDPYDSLLKSKIADLNNISSGPFAGSITAALFLRRFVERTTRWVHFDVYGWTPSAKPGRPEGGEVQMARCLFDLLTERYGSTPP